MTKHDGGICKVCGGRDPIVRGPVAFSEGTCTCLPDGPWTVYVCRRHGEHIKARESEWGPCCMAGPWVPIQVVRTEDGPCLT